MEDSVYEAVGSIGGFDIDDGLDAFEDEFPDAISEKPKPSKPCLLPIEIIELPSCRVSQEEER